jgi:hypothetical protein
MSFFGAPPITIRGMRAQVFAECKPQNVIEEILANHMVDKAWEPRRHKRYAAHSLNAAVRNALVEALHPLCIP